LFNATTNVYYKDFNIVDTNAAYTFCFWMTIAQAVPYVLLLLAVVMFAISCIKLPFLLTTAAIQCFIQSIVYTHVED
jgi:hypothetical protein